MVGDCDNAPVPTGRVHILNLSYPDTLEEAAGFFRATGHPSCIDELASSDSAPYLGFYTAPANAKSGDVCLFMCAKGARAKAVRILREADRRPAIPRDLLAALDAIEKSVETCGRLGGKVFGKARILGPSVTIPGDERWKSRTYAELGNYESLESPVDVLAAEPLVKVNRFGSITYPKGEGLSWLVAECGLV